MRALDPRLVRRTRSVRPLLIVDTALGVVTTAFVLLQATLLARIVAGAFAGAPASELRRDAVALALAFAGRGALAWGMEVAGRRAACERPLRAAPRARRAPAGDAADRGRRDAVRRDRRGRGAGGRRARGVLRPLPAAGRARLDRPARRRWRGWPPSTSSRRSCMAVTLPLVPVFMWLIGRATEQRTRERWHALRGLSTDFLDVVRGLPTLRSFNRGAAQASPHRRGQRAPPPRDDGDAAPHVPVGDGARAGGHPRRRARRGDGRRAAGRRRAGPPGRTDGARARPRALPAPAPAGRGVSRERRRPGGRRPDARAARRAGRGARGRAGAGPEPRGGAGAPGARRLLLSGAPRPACSTGSTSSWRPARPWRSWARAAPARAPWRRCCSGSWSRRPAASRSAASTSPAAGSTTGARSSRGCPSIRRSLRGSVADNIRLGRPASDARGARGRGRSPAPTTSSRAPARAATTTVVGDGGRPLSPGERRRIGLARAFLGDAPLVVLDEPTADLDPASVEHVSRAVRRLSAGRTMLLIAHRPELVAHADRIVRLEDGAARRRAGAVGGMTATLGRLLALADAPRGARRARRRARRPDGHPRARG